MKTVIAAIATVILLGLSSTVSAQSDGPATSRVLPLHANRIVGLWDSAITVAPCLGGPANTFRAVGVFNAGGTLGFSNTFPPSAAGPAYGVWSYNWRTRQHRALMRFNRYLPDGSFDGLQEVHRTITLSANGSAMIETIYARVLNPDDSLRVELCGSASSQRVM